MSCERGAGRHDPRGRPESKQASLWSSTRPEPPGPGPGVRHAGPRGALVYCTRHVAGTHPLAWTPRAPRVAGRFLVRLPLGRGGPAAPWGWGVGSRPREDWSQPGGSPTTLSPTFRRGPHLPPHLLAGGSGQADPPWALGADISRWAPRGALCGTVSGVRWECWALDSSSRKTL